MSTLTTFPPFFGPRRRLALPPIEAVELVAGDGALLRLHHIPGAGPAVLLAPGTAMTGLSYCLDTVRQNLAEHLHGAGFDLWLLDWRSSPWLPAHRLPYTLADVARFDWPAAVAAVRSRTSGGRVSVLAHCLSAPSLFLSILRGQLSPDDLDAIVASQVAFHLVLPTIGKLKSLSHLDQLLPEGQLIHLKSDEVTLHLADAAISALATLLPQSCDSDACHRQSATFGNLVCHAQLNDQTHALLAELIPEVSVGFLRDVTPLSRQLSALSEEDERHLDRLRLPITFLSGEHNETLAPLGTEESYQQLCSAHGPALYRRHVLAGYGHLDCLIGKDADRDVFPLIAQSLGPLLRAHRTGSSVLT